MVEAGRGNQKVKVSNGFALPSQSCSLPAKDVANLLGDSKNSYPGQEFL